MKKIISLSKIVLSIAFIAITVTVAHAWTAPTPVPPNGNVPAPVNTGNVPQTKNANFSVIGNLSATMSGFFGTLVNSPKARIGCLLVCNDLNSNGIFTAGLYANGIFSQGVQVTSTGGTLIGPINGSTGNGNGAVVDSTGDFTVGKRLNWFVQGLSVATSNGKTTITGPLAITSGTPAAGKILTATDNAGNTAWSDAPDNGTDLTTAYVVKSTGSPNTDAWCASGDVLLGGGGHCSAGGGDSACTNGRCPVSSSEPGPGKNSNGSWSIGEFSYWHVDCTGSNGNISKTASAYAICIGPNGGGGSGQPSPSNPTWHNLTAVSNPPADSATSQSCSSWLSGTAYANYPKQASWMYGPLSNPFVTTGCIYKLSSPVWISSYSATASAPGVFVDSKTICVPGPASGSPVAGGKPVKSCVDSAAQWHDSTGAVFNTTLTANTQVEY